MVRPLPGEAPDQGEALPRVPQPYEAQADQRQVEMRPTEADYKTFPHCPCLGYCTGYFCCTDLFCSCYRGKDFERLPEGKGQYDKALRKMMR